MSLQQVGERCIVRSKDIAHWQTNADSRVWANTSLPLRILVLYIHSPAPDLFLNSGNHASLARAERTQSTETLDVHPGRISQVRE